ncbi:copper resistance protein NlpE N-terminal domain-containing protein [Stenoxybacter acetivorans]|uniref:copper resistance protein NlpE N-terminal domain-containing protein n=1 Tax=Stenoxybacter acetivorans TaxID=422441 RepID=UPI000565CB68|nr:copper resistance protein NlpE N-terminal domain-containing protein [Stenoxybacter acetivorans]
MRSVVFKYWRQYMQGGILLILGAVLLSACQPKAADVADFPLPALGAAVSPQDAAAWVGIYRGQLLCPNCDYIEARLELFPDQQYRFNSRYVGRVVGELPREITGQFHWRPDGLLQLDQAGDRMVFFVDGKQLQMRGEDGKAYPDAKGKVCGLDKQH